MLLRVLTVLLCLLMAALAACGLVVFTSAIALALGVGGDVMFAVTMRACFAAFGFAGFMTLVWPAVDYLSGK